MLGNLSAWSATAALIQSLVARELKARYRGSVLGFFWSFVNPLLLLGIYSFIFTTIMPNRIEGLQPYALFMLCGILPWTWFCASLTEASGSLIAGGNLIKKVLFPAEVLPIVSVLANMVHFFLALPIVVAVLLLYRHWPDPGGLAWFPVVVRVQLVFTTGVALALAALAVHFRDIRDILANVLMLWFFSTPIIYSLTQTEFAGVQALLRPQPLHAPRGLLSGNSLLQRALRALAVARGAGHHLDRRVPGWLLALRPPAGLVRGSRVSPP